MTRPSVILDTTVRLIFDGAVVFSVYLVFAGHNQPGGGFVGGLVAAAAIALRYLVGGQDEVRSTVRVAPWTLLSVGLLLSVVTALIPLASGSPPLDHRALEWKVELLGKVKVTSATVFDAGVYLIVVGLVLMIVEALGGDDETAAGAGGQDAGGQDADGQDGGS